MDSKLFYPVLAVLVILGILWVGTSGSSGDILIGVIGPLSGPASQYGLSLKNGTQLAISLINKNGGIRGKRLGAVYLDDANDKIVAAEAGRDAIYKHGVIGIIGAINSDNTMNLQRICEKARIPLLTSVSTNPFITRVNFKYSFRCLSDDNIQATELARYAYAKKGIRRLAIIHDNNKYGAEGARTYRNYASQLGQTVVANEGYETDAVNFSSQLDKIKKANPDGLLVWGLYRESAMIVRQAREMGLNVPILGGDGMALPTFIDIAGVTSENVILTFPFHPPRGGDLAQTFLQDYKNAYGMEPDSFAAHGYDAMMLLARGLSNSDVSGAGLRDALAQIRQYDGVTGKGGFDETGNETKPVQLAQVKNGQFVLLSEGASR